MKVFVYNENYHFKNKSFIDYFINKYHTAVHCIDDAEIIYSPNQYIDFHNYPTKKFIFGPHFSVFPNNIVSKFNNIHKNAIYIQPSQPSVNTWQKEFGFNALPMKAIPFGVDTVKFSENEQSHCKNVIVYYKSRQPPDFKFLLDFLNNKKIKYRVFDYNKKYIEDDFISYIKTCKYGIVLGRHESQGFAIQEMLSCNIPLLVWGAIQRRQEYPFIMQYNHVKSVVSTVPYWSSTCGEIFYKPEDLEKYYNIFIEKLETYKPRQFILDAVSIDSCCVKWNNLLKSL